MDIKQLRAFLTVVDTGNITRAAEMLHLVQPAVSRQIKLLEEDLGVEVFVRERHGMVLTEAGQALVIHARRVMLELDRARAQVTGSAGQVGGLVTLGLLPSSTDALSAPLISKISASYPGIQLRIVMGYAGTLRDWLHKGEIDAALLYGSEASSNIQTSPLLEEPLWLIGPPSLDLRRERPVALASLVDKPLVLPSPAHGIRTILDHACAVSKLKLNVLAETNALSIQRSLVLRGHGLTILPPIAVAEDLKSNRLSGAPVGEPMISRTIVLGINRERPLANYVRLAVDLLVETAESVVASGEWMEGRWLGKAGQRVS